MWDFLTMGSSLTSLTAVVSSQDTELEHLELCKPDQVFEQLPSWPEQQCVSAGVKS